MKRFAGCLAPRAYTLNDSCCCNKKERKKEKRHPTNPCFPTPLGGKDQSGWQPTVEGTG